MLATPVWLKLPVAKNRPELSNRGLYVSINNGLPSARCPEAGCAQYLDR